MISSLGMPWRVQIIMCCLPLDKGEKNPVIFHRLLPATSWMWTKASALTGLQLFFLTAKLRCTHSRCLGKVTRWLWERWKQTTTLWCGRTGKISLSRLHLHILSKPPAIRRLLQIQKNGWSCSVSMAQVRYFWCQARGIDKQSRFWFWTWRHNLKDTSNGQRDVLLWHKAGKDFGGSRYLGITACMHALKLQ